jgi:hypothetical protein
MTWRRAEVYRAEPDHLGFRVPLAQPSADLE